MKIDERKTIFLAFLAITVVTSIIILFANVGYFGEEVRESEFAKWGYTVVIAEIIAASVATYRTLLLSSEEIYAVNLSFVDKKPYEIDLDDSKCTYELKDVKGNVKKGSLNVFQASETGNWRCYMPIGAKPLDSIKLHLEEKDGNVIDAGPFRPFAVTWEVRT